MASGPDQGFAWVIALACFVINFIMAGLARTAGVLFVAVIELFGVSREAATTPFSIRVCVRNMTGPLIGLLGQKYGIRGVTTIGGLVAAIGSMLCYFAPNVLYITMFWGVIHGFGFGLSTVLHMVAVNQYFDKYKATALGLGYSGDCFGTFAFPVLIEHLFATYGVRGSFLIIGGMVLNVVPMGLLLRKPPWITDGNKPAKQESNKPHKPVTLKNHTNSLLLGRTKLKTNAHKQLSPLEENGGQEKEGVNDFDLRNIKNITNTDRFSTLGTNLKGQYNKGFECSETDINTLSKNLSCKYNDNINENAVLNKDITESCLTSGTNKINEDLDIQDTEMDDGNNFRNIEDITTYTEIRTCRSVSEVGRRMNEFHCNINRSLRLEKNHNMNYPERNESLPTVLERDRSLKGEKDKSKSDEATMKEAVVDTESPRIDGTGTLKKRTSSFVGQVAQELVNRMRTASFASHLAQDAFVTTIGQELESEPEEECECELKSIVEHKDHDVEHCTNKDLVLSIDKNMKGDPQKENCKEPEVKTVDKPSPPSVIKQLIQTNLKPMFILISISMAAYAFLFVGVLTIIIDYASDQGIPEEQGKYLIIGFSVADLIGRLSFGQVIDRKLMKMKNFCSCTMSLMGILTAVIPLNTSYNYTMVCMCMYGLVQGGTAIMFPILVNMYMDKSAESVAMGCLNFYGGLLMLLMAPMIGFFRDNTGSYNCVFYIIGGVVAVVGIFWQFEPMIIKFQNRKLREKYIMKENNAMNVQK